MADKPLIFISCGQYTEEERDLGNAIERYIREETEFEAYFAEQQNTLEGLIANILSSISRCAAFIGIMHHRGRVEPPKTNVIRGSVWVEQELAIAAFIQHVLKRKIEVALYLQKGIALEGMRQQLRLRPIEFENSQQVLQDIKQRIAKWSLQATKTHSLIAEWQREDLRITGERHDYRLRVNLFNNSSVKVEDWRIELDFPKAFLEGLDRSGQYKRYEDNDSNYSVKARRLYPGDRLPVFVIDYHVDGFNWPGWSDSFDEKKKVPEVQIRVCSGDMEPWQIQIPMSQLEKF